MAFPAGITLRQIRCGVPFANPDGGGLGMRATFTPQRTLIWGPTGDPAIKRAFPIAAPVGGSGIASVPVTDQAGWRLPGGGSISVADGAQAFLYTVLVEYLDEKGHVIDRLDPFDFAVPTGDLTPIDLDLSLPSAGSDPEVQVPDTTGYDGGTEF